jgi:hypothetical protein
MGCSEDKYRNFKRPFLLTLLPQLGLDFHKNKTFCVFNPLIFRTGIFRSAAKAPVVPT